MEPEFPFDIDADWSSRLSLDSVADGSVESSDDRLNLVSDSENQNRMDVKIYIKQN